MNFFQTLSSVLYDNGTCTILIRKESPSGMTVAFVPDRDAIKNRVLPFIVSGTPAEIDEGIVDAMMEPLKAMSGLTTNRESVLNSVRFARKSQEDAGETAPSPAEPAVKPSPEAPAETAEQQSETDRLKADYETMNDLYKKGKKALAEGKKGEAWSLFNKALEFCHSEKSNAILRKSIDACGHIDDDTALFGNAVS